MVRMLGKDGFNSAAHAARHVIIVGGGASGVLLAAQLLRHEGPLRVTIVERRALLGCGVAYSTSDPGHLLNTRVSNMSAWPDQPDHFLNWLRATHDPDACPFSFVSRGLYGEYMASLLDPWRDSDKLNCARQDCLRIEEPAGGGVIAHLADGTRLEGDIVVLATGHLLPDDPGRQPLSQPWATVPDGMLDDRILIVGSGLTMIDQVISLRAQGHRGTISVLSRRGLLPQVHAPTTPVGLTRDTLPLGAGAAQAMRWIRAAARAHIIAGGDWRDVVDGLRPHVQTLWRAMPEHARATFLRHACVWWEVHRHRMPPQSWQTLQDAISDGQLTFLRGAFVDVSRGTHRRIYPRVRLNGQSALQVMVVERIIDCRGIRRDPALHAGPVVGNLLSSGRARLDSLGIGLDVDESCAVLRPDGTPSQSILAIGPVSRAAFWEITAIPDIREQAARLASRLHERRASPGVGGYLFPDYGIGTLDEYRNRDDFESEARTMIDEQKP